MCVCVCVIVCLFVCVLFVHEKTRGRGVINHPKKNWVLRIDNSVDVNKN